MSTGINKALAVVLNSITAIKKEHIRAVGFAARTIEQVMNDFSAWFKEAGIILLPEVESVDFKTVETVGKKSDGTEKVSVIIWCRVRMRYSLYSVEDGTSVSFVFAGEGMDFGSDKATIKAQQSAYKYGLLQVFSVPTVEGAASDADRETHELPAAPKKPAPAQAQKPEPHPNAEHWVTVEFPELLKEAKTMEDLTAIREAAESMNCFSEAMKGKMKAKAATFTTT